METLVIVECADGKTRNVGRKKRPIPTRTAKIESDILAKAEFLAREDGITVTDWLNRALRPIVERKYDALFREKAPTPRERKDEMK